MLRLSRLWENASEKIGVEVYEPPRPKTVDGRKRQEFTKPKSAPVPVTLTQTAKPASIANAPVQSLPRDNTYSAWDVPRLTKTPWELERSKKNTAWRRSKPAYEFPAHVFENLPREVYDCIVSQLEQIHLGRDQACASCYLRDLRNLSLTSRAWDKAATDLMYRKVIVLTNEEHGKFPKHKILGTSRLKLLRRTLRERIGLAQRVRELQLSELQALYHNAGIGREEIVNLVASLVMACPRLERLVGFHVSFSHDFDRLSYALATRSNLKERVWIMSDTDGDCGEYDDDEELSGHYVAACDPTERFLELNSNHTLLSTLILHQGPNQTSTHLNFRAVVGTFRSFPLLRHLSVSGLGSTSFTNLALNNLPGSLQSIRLENLPGVTDKGIQRFIASHRATTISKLTLINMEINSLVTVSGILSPHLVSLKEFSLIQDAAPTLSGQVTPPDFNSSTLRFLHWELRSQAGPLPTFPSHSSVHDLDAPSFSFANTEPVCCLATSLLAASISDHAFPSLRCIRIPHDPQGIIQALCKPLATALLPSDTSKFATTPRISTSNGFSIILDEHVPLRLLPRENSTFVSLTKATTRADSAIGSSAFAHLDPDVALAPMRSRLAAQSRILAERKSTAMTLRVFSPEGEVLLNRAIGGYMGHVGSSITYGLRADRGAYRELSGWRTGIEDLVGDEYVEIPSIRRGNCGRVVSARMRRGVVDVEQLF